MQAGNPTAERSGYPQPSPKLQLDSSRRQPYLIIRELKPAAGASGERHRGANADLLAWKIRQMNSTPTRISLVDLQETAASFPLKVRQEPNWTTFNLATSIIGHFLGKEWVKANIVQEEAGSANPVGFFQMDFSSPEKAEAKTARILDFAETLFNLQHVSGFDDRTNQMRTGDAEAAYAEFDFGRFLYIHDIDFRFVVPSGRRGATTIAQ
jgi:hypothetical protein